MNLSRVDFFLFFLFSKFLSNEENLKFFGKCNNLNGYGYNYKGERKIDEILVFLIRVKECSVNVV